nr:reverse transcriptase domain-containing protein [Tanacetum cinerariifolium]
AFLLDKKNQYSAPAPSPTPAPVKAVEPNCATCCGQLHRPQVNQPPAYLAPTYQALVPQTQSVSQTDFERYVKANDVVLRNIQSQGQRSGTLPGNTITNPKEDLKGITTRSGVAYQGPTIPTPSKVAKQRTEIVRSLNQSVLLKMSHLKLVCSISQPTFWSLILNQAPRVPLILERCFLKTGRALIDVHKGELTLHIENEAITYNLDQTSRYSADYDQMTANKIDVTNEACEEYSQELIGFFDITASGSPTPFDNPIVSITSPTLTPIGDSNFLLFEEADAFLSLEDDPDSPKFDPSYYDPEGDILLLEAILNSEPSPPLPNYEQSVPSFKKELKACEAKMIKSSVDEP